MYQALNFVLIFSMILTALGPIDLRSTWLDDYEYQNDPHIENVFLQDPPVTETPLAETPVAFETPVVTETPLETSTPEASATPNAEPTQDVTIEPTLEATVEGTATPQPTDEVPVDPTAESTATATLEPTTTPTLEPTITPTETIEAKKPLLILFLDNSKNKLGKSITVNWSIGNLTDLPVDNSWLLRFVLPSGIEPAAPENGKFDPQTGTFVFALVDTKGSIVFKTTKGTKAGEIRAALLEEETVLCEATLEFTGGDTKRIKKEGGEASGMGGKVKVKFPKDALTEEVEITIQSDDSIPPMSSVVYDGSFQLTATSTKSQKNIHKFSKDVDVEFAYEMAGINNPFYLRMYYYDPDRQEWVRLPASVDLENRVLRGRTNHFSLFSVTDENWNMVNIAPLDPAAVSDFTGATSYSIPINVPAGPGGIQPSISLDYNSQTAAGATNKTQAGFPGMGWELNSGAYIRAERMGDEYDGNDIFTLTIGNTGYKLIPIASTDISPNITYVIGGYTYRVKKQIEYRTADESFIKIRRYCISGGPIDKDYDEWYVWDKTGGMYAFKPYETATNRAWKMDTYYQESTNRWMDFYRTWIWGAAYYQNAAGKKLVYKYSYLDGEKTGCSQTLCGTDHLSFYPTEVIYPGNVNDPVTKVEFVWDTERGDYLHEWVNNQDKRPRFYTHNLTGIRVKIGDKIIREYDLVFFQDSQVQVYPGIKWDPVTHDVYRKTLVLKSVQECGIDGVAGGNCLPPISLTYGDASDNTVVDTKGNYPGLNNDMLLTKVDNGQGGSVSFTYETELRWLNANGEVVEIDAGVSHQFIDPEKVFYNTEGELISADKIKTFQPGIRYRITCDRTVVEGSENAGQGAQIRYVLVGDSSGTPRVEGQVFTLPQGTSSWTFRDYLVLPSTASQAQFNIEVVTPTRSFEINNCEIATMVTPYRVTKKTISDSITGKTINSFTYLYGTPAVNDSAHSEVAAIYNRPEEGDDWRPVLTPDNSEFRGHNWTVSTDLYNNRLATYFYQDDLLKGRPWQIETRHVHINQDQSESQTIFTRKLIYYEGSSIISPDRDNRNTPYCAHIDNSDLYDLCFADMRRYKVQVSSEEQMDFGTTGIPQAQFPSTFMGTRTEYVYDDWGNVTKTVQKARDASGNAWEEKRVTLSGYGGNNTGYSFDGMISFSGSVSSESTIYRVGLPTFQNLYTSSNGALVSSTCFIYDHPINGGSGICGMDAAGNMTIDAPQSGLLTGKRTLLSSNSYADEWYKYDEWGNQIEAKSSPLAGTATQRAVETDARKTTTTYDVYFHARPTSVKNALDRTTTYSYGGTSDNSYWLGLPQTETDPNGASAVAMYDAFGRMVWLRIDPDTETTYEAVYHTGSSTMPYWIEVSRLVADQTRISTRNVYNGLGQLIQTQIGNVDVVPTGQSTEQKKDIVVETEYNAYGQVVKQSAPTPLTVWTWNGSNSPRRTGVFINTPKNFTITSYFDSGHMEKVTAPDDTYTSYAYTISGGRMLTSVTDAKGNVTQTQTDAEGQTIQVTPPTGPGVSYVYTPGGLLKTATRGGVTTTLTYDLAGRKTQMIDPDMGTWTYAYDALSNLKTQTDARACTTTLSYNKINQLIGKSFSTGCSSTTGITYNYDETAGVNGIGRRTSMTDASGSTFWKYDARGRMTEEKKIITGGGTFLTQWTYFSNDQVESITYPGNNTGGSGEVVNYTYLPQGTLDTVKNSAIDYVSDTKYDEASRIVERTFNNSLESNFSYYPWTTQGGRLNTLKSGTSDPNIPIPSNLQNLTYTYDSIGNITKIVDNVLNSGMQTQTFGYDAASRLTSANITGGTIGKGFEQYQYDSTTGNLIHNGDNALMYGDQDAGCSGASEPAHAVTRTENTRYCYDANGNQTQKRVYTSMVTNPSFESADGWTASPASAYPNTALYRSIWGSAEPHDGAFGYSISNQAYGYLESDVIAVTANTSYTLSVYVKGEIDPADSKGAWVLRAVFFDSAGNALAAPNNYKDAVHTAAITSTWTQKTGTVTAPSGAAKMRIHLLSYMNAGWVAFDDVSLTAGGQPLTVNNPGFEDTVGWTEHRVFAGTSFWRASGTSGMPAPHGGTIAYIISNLAYGSVFSEMIPVSANTQYTLSAWVHGELDGKDTDYGSWKIELCAYKSDGTSISPCVSTSGLGGGPGSINTTWAQKSGTVTTPADAAFVKFRPYLFISSGWVAYDDVSLVKAGTSTNLLPDPGFETGSGWTESRDGRFPNTGIFRGYYGTAAPHGGTYSYVISNHAYGTISTSSNIPVTPGRTYDLRAFVRGEMDPASGNGYWFVRAQYYNANGGWISNYANTASGGEGSLNEGWKSVGGTFTPPADAAFVRVQLIAYMISGWVAFDDISLTDITSAPAQVITMTYDAENHMTAYTTTGTTATFVYDGDGKRVKGTVNNVTTLYVGAHFEWSNNTMKKYYFAGAQRIAVRDGNTTGTTGLTFLFADHLGSTSVSVNAATNTPTGELRYGAWGDTRYFWPNDGTAEAERNALPTNARYTGQYEAMGGLYYYNARWYDSELGRFLSADTMIPGAGNPQAWDRYAYTSNNPVNLTDPTGHYACGDGIDDPRCDQYDPSGSTYPVYKPAPSTSSLTTIGPDPNYVPPTWGPQEYNPNDPFSCPQQACINPVPSNWDVNGENPDYNAVSVSLGLPDPPVGGTVVVTRDRFGSYYVAVGPTVGKTLTVGSVSLVKGYIGSSSDLYYPNPSDTESFLTGLAVNGSAGFVKGYGVTWSPFAGDRVDHLAFEESGFGGFPASGMGNFPNFGGKFGFTPSIGMSVTWGWKVYP